MTWTEEMPKPGDIIRIKVKFYYHYGIFADNNTVIQFGLPNNVEMPPEKVLVVQTDISEFLVDGAMLETARFDRKEKAQRRSPKETVEYATSKIGTGGYHILHNNCEHFVSECVFGEARSSFVDSVRNSIRKKIGRG